MLSKCLNPRCSAKFRYLRQGRLYRIDFFEEYRKRLRTGGGDANAPNRPESIEYFWLCESCATSLTLQVGEGGELRLVPVPLAPRKPLAAELIGIEDIASNA